MFKLTSFFVVAIFLIACNPPKHPNPAQINIKKAQIVVLNEGGFGYKNASFSLFNADSNKIYNDIYWLKNNEKLGDVLQSVNIINNKYYWVLNNSGKIVITDTSFIKIGEIKTLNSPRYILPITETKAYVTDYTANKIAVVNLKSNIVENYIPCKGWTEYLIEDAFNPTHIWVSNKYSEYIYKINSTTDIIEDSIKTIYGTDAMVFDKNNNLWVTCGGESSKHINSAIFKINTSTKQILNKIETSSTLFSSHLQINSTKDTLYWLDSGVKKMSINSNIYPTSNFISENNRLFYGLNINPVTNEIYVTDAVDYVQSGYLIKYSTKGTELGNYKVGIIPNGVYFNY